MINAWLISEMQNMIAARADALSYYCRRQIPDVALAWKDTLSPGLSG
jgi:hypothetical protein